MIVLDGSPRSERQVALQLWRSPRIRDAYYAASPTVLPPPLLEDPRAHLGLVLSFATGEASGAHCDVFEGRPRCGNAVWNSNSKETQHAEEVVIEALADPGEYAVYLAASPLERCSGYGRPASSRGDATIDCIGNCSSGRGYCVATLGVRGGGRASDSLTLPDEDRHTAVSYCTACVLWDPLPTETLCSDVGVPQGSGPLPSTETWQLAGCNTDRFLTAARASPCRPIQRAPNSAGDLQISSRTHALSRLVRLPAVSPQLAGGVPFNFAQAACLYSESPLLDVVPEPMPITQAAFFERVAHGAQTCGLPRPMDCDASDDMSKLQLSSFHLPRRTYESVSQGLQSCAYTDRDCQMAACQSVHALWRPDPRKGQAQGALPRAQQSGAAVACTIYLSSGERISPSTSCGALPAHPARETARGHQRDATTSVLAMRLRLNLRPGNSTVAPLFYADLGDQAVDADSAVSNPLCVVLDGGSKIEVARSRAWIELPAVRPCPSRGGDSSGRPCSAVVEVLTFWDQQASKHGSTQPEPVLWLRTRASSTQSDASSHDSASSGQLSHAIGTEQLCHGFWNFSAPTIAMWPPPSPPPPPTSPAPAPQPTSLRPALALPPSPPGMPPPPPWSPAPAVPACKESVDLEEIWDCGQLLRQASGA